MLLDLKKEECCGCAACADICPVHAIHMERDKEGFAYPHIDKKLCVCCGKCTRVCPAKGDSDKQSHNQYFGAKAKNEEVRYSSSSGGIFSVLAEYIFGQKGVVYGAGYSGNMEVAHREAAGRAELEKIKGTKYVQSNMQGIFLQVKQRLRENLRVLFCGTPCQAHALRLFLGQEYDRLVVADLVCYGVASPGIWEDYVKYLEGRHQGKMTDFSFRDKRAGDHGHTCAYVIDGREYSGSLYQDKFCREYFRNHILRPSCHCCKFCTVNRDSDFTIGDFWGIENIRPDMDDGMGNSIVILHTDKAKEIWCKVQPELSWFECAEEEILQPRLLEPSAMSRKRGLYMSLYRLLPFSWFISLAEK